MRYILTAILLLAPAAAWADPPSIISARASQGNGAWRLDVTLTHPDTGWDHYADGWRIETADGTVLGTRKLLHPHVSEQPFTRSLGGVSIPEDVGTVFIRARCNIDGWADTRFALDLTR